MNPRTKARQTALQVLYKLDVSEDGLRPRDFSGEMDELAPGTEANRYCTALVDGVIDKAADLDRMIEEASEKWKVDRISIVDRNILRLAAYELAFEQDVPFKVVIDEAIELAKRFGAEDSGAFINGILDRLRKELPSRDATHTVNKM